MHTLAQLVFLTLLMLFVLPQLRSIAYRRFVWTIGIGWLATLGGLIIHAIRARRRFARL